MPRRATPDPLAKAVGARIRQLREAAGLTIEKLAYESELGSKGHPSTLERGLARPTIQTLQVIADRLEVKLLDLVTFPEEDDRAKLIDSTRSMSATEIKRVLKGRRK
jgi:transcriptional regulator with XRE-family HTH domain